MSARTGGPYLVNLTTITKTTVPSQIGPALDAANRALATLPKDKVATLLHETSVAVGGLGPSLRRLVDATGAIAHDFRGSIDDIDDIIAHAGPIIDSQADSGDDIARWAANLNTLTAQTAQQDPALRSILANAAPTADQVNATFNDVRDALPQTLANLEVVLDMLKRYHNGFEQALVFLPQSGAIAQSVTALKPGQAALGAGALSFNTPPPCLTGFLPASQWRAPGRHQPRPATGRHLLQDSDGGAECRSRSTQLPVRRRARQAGSEPAGVPQQRALCAVGHQPLVAGVRIRSSPARRAGARCDQSVRPGQVIPAPSVGNTGDNPLPADRVPGTPPPVSDPLQRPGSGTVQCNGQQPNPCIYDAEPEPRALYDVQSGQVVGPDGVVYSVENSRKTGDNGWKDMLAPTD